MRIILFIPLASFCVMAAFGQGGRSAVSIGAGGGLPAGGYLTDEFSGGAAFAATYEFRLLKYVAPEIGLTDMLPKYTDYEKYETSVYNERVTLLSFGVRGVLPLAHGRVELFAGPAAAHLWSSSYYLTQGYHAPAWLFEIDAGARIAVDRRHRFWIGPAARFARDAGRPTEEWISLTGDFGFRF
jgi:hypothetical protein